MPSLEVGFIESDLGDIILQWSEKTKQRDSFYFRYTYIHSYLLLVHVIKHLDKQDKNDNVALKISINKIISFNDRL